MPIQRYRIRSPLMATFLKGDHRVAVKIPEGSVVVVESEVLRGDDLVEAVWAEMRVMLFSQDIRARGMKVEQADA